MREQIIEAVKTLVQYGAYQQSARKKAAFTLAKLLNDADVLAAAEAMPLFAGDEVDFVFNLRARDGKLWEVLDAALVVKGYAPASPVTEFVRTVRPATMAIITHYDTQEAIVALLERMEATKEHPEWQANCIQALGELGQAAMTTVDTLMLFLDHEKPRLWGATAEALGKIGDSRALPKLIEVLQREANEHVRRNVIDALAALGGAEAGQALTATLEQFDSVTNDHIVRALGKLGVLAPLVTQLATHEDNYSRYRATLGLGISGDPAAVEPLIAALQDDYWHVGYGATVALGELGDKRAVEPLITVLREKGYATRREAARALGKIGDVKAVPALIESLSDTDLPDFALRDNKPTVRAVAEDSLRTLGTPEASKAIDSLPPIPPPPLERVLALVNKKPPTAHLMKLLVHSGDSQAIAVVIDTLKNHAWSDVRRGAAIALDEANTPAVIEALRAALDDDEEVQEAARQSLKKLGADG